MDKPHLNYGKAVFLTFIIASTLPVIMHNVLQSMESLENAMQELFFFCFDEVSLSSPKTDCKNKNTTSKL